LETRSVNHLPQFYRRACGVLARDLPETAPHATSRRHTTQPSAAPFTCSVAWVGEAAHGDVNHPSINGMQGVRGSTPLSSTRHNASAGHPPRAVCQQITPCGRIPLSALADSGDFRPFSRGAIRRNQGTSLPRTAGSTIWSAFALTVNAKLGEVVHGRAIRLLSDPFTDAARAGRCRSVANGLRAS
jgi:hypothetical protein